MKRPLSYVAVLALTVCSFVVPAHAVVLVQTSDPGFLNRSIGTLLNGTSNAFPGPGDPSLDFSSAQEPNLSAAASALGGWLDQPVPDLSAPGWSDTKVSVPSTWPVNTEIAFVYEFVSGGITGLTGKFGVDNGLFVWLDGNFIGGALRPGGVSLGEHVFNLGNLSSGTHHLQVLLEDHGSTNGFAVLIEAQQVLPPPPPDVVPQPAALLLVGSGLLAARFARGRLLRAARLRFRRPA